MARDFKVKITEQGVPVALEIPLVAWSIKTPSAPTTGKYRFYVKGAWTLTQVRASLGTAASTGTTTVDVNINGTTVFGTQTNRPQITATTNTDLADAIDTTAVTDGQYLTMDVDAVGTGAAELTVQVWARRT